MAFGTVRVWMESGAVQEIDFTKPSTSVGRLPGNDIVLPTTAVSRYHAQFEAAEGQVFIVDLGTVNGTFVNDIQLEPNGKQALNDGDVIMVGDARLVFSSPEARPFTALMPSAEPIEKEGVPFRLVLDEPFQDVAPGARLNLTLLIENRGREEQACTIDVGGMPADWAKTNWKELTLSPDQQAEVTISVKPPRATDTRPGRYPLKVRVAVKEDPLQFLEATREIDVVAYAGLAMNVTPTGRNENFRVDVQNQGNADLDLQFGGFNRDKSLKYRFGKGRISLGPGEADHIKLEVRPNGGRSSGKPIEFAVVARSLDAAGYQAPVRMTTTFSSSRLMWVAGLGLPAIIGFITLIVLVIAGLFVFNIIPVPAFGGNAPAPVTSSDLEPSNSTETLLSPTAGPSSVPYPEAAIQDFSVVPVNVAYMQTGEVTLGWRASGVEFAVILNPAGEALPIDFVPSDGIAEVTGKFDLPISTLLPGEHLFEFRVVGDDAQARSRSAAVTVTPQICRFATDAEPLVYPEPAATGAARPISPRADLVIAGRNNDGSWIRITDDGGFTFSWLPVANIVCGPDALPFNSFVEVAGSG